MSSGEDCIAPIAEARSHLLDEHPLDDAEWSTIEAALPRWKNAGCKLDNRAFVTAALIVARHGNSWHLLPLVLGSHRAIRSKFFRFCEHRLWLTIYERTLGALSEARSQELARLAARERDFNDNLQRLRARQVELKQPSNKAGGYAKSP